MQQTSTGRVEITSQNHNYAVAADSLGATEVTHVNLNDGVIEGLASTGAPGLQRAVPPRGRPRPPRRPLPVRGVPDADGRPRRAERSGADDREGRCLMPRRDDLESILVIGSGPIVIGQACEFDYSGTQACRVLAEEGYRVVLANSNPATIMTDPGMADRTYVEPLDPDVLTAIIERERPDALLPTLGGQTALNLTMALSERGRARGQRRGGHRGQPGGHRHRRGPGAVQGGHGGDRSVRPGVGLRPLARRGHGHRRVDRLPDHGAPELHPGRRRHRHRRRPRGPHPAGRRGPRRLAHQRGARRALDRRPEGVRARGHARPRRQLRGHLLDRELRPDGRPHRRLHHRGPGPDPDRRRVPGDARLRLRLHPSGGGGDRRLQRAVRGGPARPATRRSSR